jgi:ATP-dependent helicase/nuclease subunit A
MKLTTQQEVAVTTEDRALLVEAGAGTGKTSVLTERFLGLLDRHPDWPLEGIIAVTFTEKATREMRSRIREGVEARARHAPSDSPWHDRRRDLDRVQVSTIHGLCARMLRENAIAAGIDPRFDVLNEQEADVLKEEAIRQALAELSAPIAGSDHSDVTTGRVESTDEAGIPLDLLAGLQVRDVREELGHLAAKRGTVERLFVHLPDVPDLLTRWRAGLAEIQQAAWREMLCAEPGLADALATLPAAVITDPADRLADAVTLAQEGCRRLGSADIAGAMGCFAAMNRSGGKAAAWGGKEALGELKAQLGIVQAAGKQLVKDGVAGQIGPDDEAAAVALMQWRALWGRVTATYDQLKDLRQQALDFDDLERLAQRLLRTAPADPRLAAYLAGIRHVMVDEFQDVNELQGEIIYALAHPSDGGRFFAVGDAKQSIYRFRQAQVRVFNRAVRDIERYTGCAPLPLNRSFRAHSELVAALNDAFDRILRPIGETHADFEARPGRLRPERLTPAPHPAAPAPVEVLFLPDVGDADETRRCEAAILAERLLALHREQLPVWDRRAASYRPFCFDDAAILFRATTSLPLYEEQFKAAGLPYLTVSGRGYYDRPEVRDLIALLACLHSPGDDLSLATVLRSPLFNLSDETLYRLRWRTQEGTESSEPAAYAAALLAPPSTGQPDEVAFAAEALAALRGMAGRVDVWRLLRAALDRTGYEATLALSDASVAGTGKAGRSRDNVAKFLALSRERGGASLSDFLRWMEDLQAREAREGEAPAGAPDAGAVQLMSVHAAKGLEFPVVVVADLGRDARHGGRAPRILHDPEFGVVCQLRDDNGDWLKPASYRWAEWLNERMELAESRRLLYVACTRAADLLILSGKPGQACSWLAALSDAWELPAGAENDAEIQRDGYRIRLRCPAPPDEGRTTSTRAAQTAAGLTEMPPLARPLPSAAAHKPIAVTHLERRLAEEAGELPFLQPAVMRGRDGSRPKRAPLYLVGNLAHRALADWDCLAAPPDALRAKLAAWARRAGITDPDALDHAVERVQGALDALRGTPLFHELATAPERYTEIPFSLGTTAGTLHGIIDLLYRDGSGAWRLVDWKTEPVRHGQTLAGAAQPHLLQMAVYAMAAGRILGIRPRVEICFLTSKADVYRCPAADLETAWQAALRERLH